MDLKRLASLVLHGADGKLHQLGGYWASQPERYTM